MSLRRGPLLGLGIVVSILLEMGVAHGQDTTVNVELNEWHVTLDASSVTTGDMTLVVTNAGSIQHELVVLETDLEPGDLPVAGSRVDEQAAGVEIGRIEPLAPGSSESATFALAPGAYVLICNIPGHYQAGMYAALLVNEPAAMLEPTATERAAQPTERVAGPSEPTSRAAQLPVSGGGRLPQQPQEWLTTSLIVLLSAGGAVLVIGALTTARRVRWRHPLQSGRSNRRESDKVRGTNR